MLLKCLLSGPGHHSGALKGQGSDSMLQFPSVVEKNRCAF